MWWTGASRAERGTWRTLRRAAIFWTTLGISVHGLCRVWHLRFLVGPGIGSVNVACCHLRAHPHHPTCTARPRWIKPSCCCVPLPVRCVEAAMDGRIRIAQPRAAVEQTSSLLLVVCSGGSVFVRSVCDEFKEPNDCHLFDLRHFGLINCWNFQFWGDVFG